MSFPADGSAVQRQYDFWARFYDVLWSRYIRLTQDRLEAWARITPGEAVLNVGCGTGAFEARLLRQDSALSITGVDVSPNMLAVARHKLRCHPSATFVQAQAAALPFEDARFDVVVSASAFHYFEDPTAALREIRRVLRPGGRLVLLDWCLDFWTCRVMNAFLRRLDPAYQQVYTLQSLTDMLDAAALAVHRRMRFRVDMLWGLMILEAVPA